MSRQKRNVPRPAHCARAIARCPARWHASTLVRSVAAGARGPSVRGQMPVRVERAGHVKRAGHVAANRQMDAAVIQAQILTRRARSRELRMSGVSGAISDGVDVRGGLGVDGFEAGRAARKCFGLRRPRRHRAWWTGRRPSARISGGRGDTSTSGCAAKHRARTARRPRGDGAEPPLTVADVDHRTSLQLIAYNGAGATAPAEPSSLSPVTTALPLRAVVGEVSRQSKACR
jgi:hypothetical protein